MSTIPTSGPYQRVSYQGHTLDALTRAAIVALDDALGFRLTVVQGSYNAGRVPQSAGTHDGGGAVDFSVAGMSPAEIAHVETIGRQIGFALYHRLPSQGPWVEHLHGILIGNAYLSPAAAAQVVDYLNGRNALAGRGPDTGSRAFVHNRFTWANRKIGADRINRARTLLTQALAELDGNHVRGWRGRAFHVRAGITTLLPELPPPAETAQASADGAG